MCWEKIPVVWKWNKVVVGLITGLILCQSSVWAAVPQSEISFGVQQFAVEESSQSRLDLNLAWQTDGTLENALPKAQFRWFSFYETGEFGDKSLDVDRTLVRFAVPKKSYFWLGRAHPHEERFGLASNAEEVNYQSALGSLWVQNQANALQPRVSGWLGAGWSGQVLGMSMTAVLAPVFLPTFGPRLNLSESATAHGARFAHLPPQHIVLGDAFLPVRYRVNTGDLSEIILQSQTYLSLGRQTEWGSFSIFGWSAPDPNPQLDTSGMVKVSDASVNVLVEAIPKFPRRNHVGFEWFNSKASFQSILDPDRRQMTLSWSVRPWSPLRVGFLHDFSLNENAVSSTTPGVSSPVYARYLAWARIEGSFFKNHFHPSLRVEQHLGEGEQGYWVMPQILYTPEENLSVFAKMNILAGSNSSYFGQWRALDSVNAGVQYVW